MPLTKIKGSGLSADALTEIRTNVASVPLTELEVTGTITANAFVGDGSGLTGVTSYTDSDTAAYLTTNSYATQEYVNSAVEALPDSAQVSSIITADVDKAFVDALSINATALNGQNAAYYLNYANFTGTPNVLDSADVRNIFSVTGDLTYNSTTGEFGVTVPEGYSTVDFDSDFSLKTTTDLAEGTNLYYTTVRADSDTAAYLTANGYDTATNIIASIVDTAPTTLDTLNELAAALGDDPNFATTISAQIGALPDSAQVSSIITADVDKTFVDALNINADTLDGQQGSYYLNYNNFTNTPSESLLVGTRAGGTQVTIINSIITVTTRTGSVLVGVT